MKCSKCKEDIGHTEYAGEEGKLIKSKKVCFTCAYWMVMYNQDKDPKNKYTSFVTPDHIHYVVGDKKSNYCGFGGVSFVVVFSDGKKVETHNLWYQGEVPKIFREGWPAMTACLSS